MRQRTRPARRNLRYVARLATWARQGAEQWPPYIEYVIQEAVRLLVEAPHPEKIILFGSYARGDFIGDSDLDFLVILPAVEDTFDEMIRLERVLLSLPVPVDVLV